MCQEKLVQEAVDTLLDSGSPSGRRITRGYGARFFPPSLPWWHEQPHSHTFISAISSLTCICIYCPSLSNVHFSAILSSFPRAEKRADHGPFARFTLGLNKTENASPAGAWGEQHKGWMAAIERTLKKRANPAWMTGTKGSTTRPNMALPSRKEQPVLPPPRSDSRARLIIGLVLLAWRGSLTSAAGSIKGGSCWAIYYSDWWKSDSCPEEDALSALEAVVSLK